MSILFVILALVLVLAVIAIAVSGAENKRLAWGSASVLMVLVVGGYGVLGRPDLTIRQAASVEVLQARAKAKMDENMALLARNAEASVENWRELANQYWSLGAPAKAAEALGSAAKIAKSAKERDGLLGAQAQALVSANNNRVGNDATAIFRQVFGRNPDDLRALFFLGLAAEQAGDETAMKTYWNRIMEIAPKNAPWRETLTARMERAAKADTAQNMIDSMVARLETRLKNKGGTAQEWAQLGKSYVVLGRLDEAVLAYKKAVALAPNDENIKRAFEAVAAQAP